MSEPPARRRCAVRAVAVDVGLLRRRRDYRLRRVPPPAPAPR